MKNRFGLRFLCLFAVLVLAFGTFSAVEKEDITNAKQKLYLSNIGTIQVAEGDEAAYQYIIDHGGDNGVSSQVIIFFLERGALVQYIDDFKAAGRIPQDYQVPGTASAPVTSPSQETPAATPESFTVETYDPAKTMWAVSNVNCRDGASTSYNKVGSLKQYEKVTVTGIASTGWYQITKEDGTIVYVSNKYLSEEDPSTDTDNSDKIVKEEGKIKEKTKKEESPTSSASLAPSPTIEPATEPTIEPDVEFTITPVETPINENNVIEDDNEKVETNNTLLLVLAGGVILVISIFGLVLIIKRKK